MDDVHMVKCQTCDLYYWPDDMHEDSGEDICESCYREKWVTDLAVTDQSGGDHE